MSGGKKFGSHPDDWLYYRVLGVKVDADIEEIKIRYKKLALQYHPGIQYNHFFTKLGR